MCVEYIATAENRWQWLVRSWRRGRVHHTPFKMLDGSGPVSQTPVTASIEAHQGISYQTSYSNGLSTIGWVGAGAAGKRQAHPCPRRGGNILLKTGSGLHWGGFRPSSMAHLVSLHPWYWRGCSSSSRTCVLGKMRLAAGAKPFL